MAYFSQLDGENHRSVYNALVLLPAKSAIILDELLLKWVSIKMRIWMRNM